MRVRARVRFHGRVQGVYFRAHCQEKARELGLDGFARNAPDGTVEAVLEGERDSVVAWIEWNRTSQPLARVTSVEVEWTSATGASHGFEIRP